jgi:hypothetical protein
MAASIGTRARVAGVVASLAMASVNSLAQQPKVSHAEFSVKSGSLQQAIAAVQVPTWIGYEFATTSRIRSGWSDNVLHLEGDRDSDGQKRVIDPDAPIPPGMVLLRVASGRVTKVHVDEVDLEIDGGGLPFVWLSSVSPAESVKTLRSKGHTRRRSRARTRRAAAAGWSPRRDRTRKRARRHCGVAIVYGGKLSRGPSRPGDLLAG